MRKYALLILLIFIAVFLELANVFLLNKVSTDSIYASKLKQEISVFEEKNMILKTEILQSTSMDMIASQAASLGFVEPTGYISLYSPLTVAVGK